MAAFASTTVGAYGARSLAQLRTTIRRRADMPLGDLNGVPREIVGDDELNEYINASLQELYDILIGHYGEDYFVAEYQFTADGTSSYVPLPFDFGKALGLDLQASAGDPPVWTRINPFEMAERNRYAFPAALGYLFPPRATNLHYRIRDNQLWLEPRPAAGTVMRLHYIPLMPMLADSAVVNVGNAVPGDTLTVNGTVITDLTSAGVATAIEAAADDVATTVTDSETLTVTPLGPDGVISWSATSGFSLSTGACTWSGWTNSRVSPWLEYVVVDCTIKCKAKEESDVGLEMAQKGALLERIETMARNRDAGAPRTVSDVRSSDWPFNGGWGSGGW